MRVTIYAIYDNKAQDLLASHVMLQRHDAVAIRAFTDLANSQGSRVPHHPADYDLVRLGYLDNNSTALVPDFAVILTGEQLMAALNANKETSRNA